MTPASRALLHELIAKGCEFVIAKAGKPTVRVVPIAAPPAERRPGVLKGKGVVTAGLTNMFNQAAPFSNYADGAQAGYDFRYGPIGRTFIMRAVYSF